jgi:predicted signal transduction protein with EAL and GGDEF domain
LNHGAYIASLQRELDAARASGKPLSVVMIDLDHFKTVNDRYDHAAGDAVLAGISALLRDSSANWASRGATEARNSASFCAASPSPWRSGMPRPGKRRTRGC